MTIAVWAAPGAARSELAGVTGGFIRIRIAAPAREGRANAELERLLAVLLGVSRGNVCVVGGARGRRKLVRARGVTMERARERLDL